MSMYRNQCPDCGDAYETEAWEPVRCPFCELSETKKELAIARTNVQDLSKALKTLLDLPRGCSCEISYSELAAPFQYYTLTITDNKGEIVKVRTSSDYSYICRLSH